MHTHQRKANNFVFQLSSEHSYLQQSTAGRDHVSNIMLHGMRLPIGPKLASFHYVFERDKISDVTAGLVSELFGCRICKCNRCLVLESAQQE